MKILKIIIKVIYNLIFVLLLISATFILLTTYDVIPGYNFYVVMSGSMQPTIPTGSVVGVKEETDYKIDDIVTIKQQNNPSETYTHRIIDILSTEKDITYKTKGDANEGPDSDLTTKDFILGKVFISVPLIGYLVHFAKQPTGFILMIIVPSIIIGASEINIIREEGIKLINSKKESKKDISEIEEKPIKKKFKHKKKKKK